jgi:hypothetical protein
MSRLTLAREAGVLTQAVEAAESVGAEGVMEQMLVHQITAAHGVGSLRPGSGSALIDAGRSAVEAVRLMDSVTRTTAALDRMRHGGRQQVTVQHLVVTDGGEAVVAGNVDAGGGSAVLGRRRKGGRGPNEQGTPCKGCGRRIGRSCGRSLWSADPCRRDLHDVGHAQRAVQDA